MNSLRRHYLPCLSVLSIAASFSLAAESATPAAPTAPAAREKIGSKVWAWDSLVVRPTGNGQRRDVVDQPTATLANFESHVTTLNAGNVSHAPHKHAQEEFIILKEGVLDVHINGQTTRATPGSILFFASNDMHAVANVGDKPATYLVFNYRTAATQAAPAAGAAAAALPGKLASQVFVWEKLEAKPTAKGARRGIVDFPTVTLQNLEGHITTLRAGEMPHDAHRHPDEELVVVKEGVMECTIDGVTQRGGPGSIFLYSSNALHGMKNVGGTEATYYVFRLVSEATPKLAAK
jgi:quercetin dioxygenase-like cupin family protein